jgi:hypothetical protein
LAFSILSFIASSSALQALICAPTILRNENKPGPGREDPPVVYRTPKWSCPSILIADALFAGVEVHSGRGPLPFTSTL